jgi:hypothetical protein
MAAVGLVLSISRRPDPWRISDQRRKRLVERARTQPRHAGTGSGVRPNVRKPGLEHAHG